MRKSIYFCINVGLALGLTIGSVIFIVPVILLFFVRKCDRKKFYVKKVNFNLKLFFFNILMHSDINVLFRKQV